MKTTPVQKILPIVRDICLDERARERKIIGLSAMVWKVTLRLGFPLDDTRSRMTSHGPKKLRGLVQKCLAILATERIMFTRQRPECGVHYEPHDKYFKYRISVEDAKKRLTR